MCVDKDPQKALASLKNAYPTRQDAKKAMSMWKQVRMSILHNESNRNFAFPDACRSLMPSCSRVDQVLLYDLIQMPCVEQHKIVESSIPYLEDEEADFILKQSMVMMPEFYAFEFPKDMELWFKELEKERNMKEMFHQLKPSKEYNFDKEEVDTIIDKSKEILLRKDIVNNKQYYEAIVAMQLLTGRRNTEIINSINFYPSSHPYQAQVSGILKDSRRFDEMIPIPILAPYQDIERTFRTIREFKNMGYYSNEQIHRMTSSQILNASKRLFGRRLTHTQKRNLYCEVAYSLRYSENHFLTDSCSKEAWVASALGHKLTGLLTQTARYQVMNIKS